MSIRSGANPRYVLGLDLGVQSIGWAVLELDDNHDPIALLASGVRCFDTGVGSVEEIQQGKDTAPGQGRRQARQMRRQLFRRQQRQRRTWRALQQAGLLPPGPLGPAARDRALRALDTQLRARYLADCSPADAHLLPYRLRAVALDQPLEPHALGRALYHLAHRRGFKGKRPTEQEAEDRSKVKQAIAKLHQELQHTAARTLGEYFARLDPEEFRIRSRWTSRAMYEAEFEAIWQAQAAHHPQLTEEHKRAIYRAIFFQRPLKSQRGLVARCSLEPSRRRAPIACLENQEFRYLQRVNDLRVYVPEGERPLTADERQRAIAALETQAEISFDKLRTLLKLPRAKKGSPLYCFSHEQGGEKKLVGNRTAAKLRKVLGAQWDHMPAEERKRLVDEILSFHDEDALARRLERAWHFDPPTARQLAETPLEDGFGGFSRKALRGLLPLLRQGMALNTAIKQLYGGRPAPQALDRLPPVRKALPTLRNPLVCRALSELRKVLNALLARYGKPELVRIELARDLKASRKERESRWKKMRENETRREQAKQLILQELDITDPTETDILKVRLAEECNWECPYTGRQIKIDQLVGPEPQFDIEHIIPRSRSLDDSFANKTLCYHEENRQRKQGCTPWEAYGADPQRWQEILQRVRRFHGPLARAKLALFQLTEIPDDFVNRQLSDTRYITRTAADYLALLYGGRSDPQGHLRIQVTKGQVTAMVRAGLDLNRILGRPDQKTRQDHRQHAIDAVVVALCGPSMVHQLTRAALRCEQTRTRLRLELDPPWPGFLDQVRTHIEQMIVSHRASRRLAGPLHEETNYGLRKRRTPDGRLKPIATVRKPLARMSKYEVDCIIDPLVQKLVQEKLRQLAGEPAAEPKKYFSDPKNHPYRRVKDKQTGRERLVPIHAARIAVSIKPQQIGRGLRARYVAPRNNSHMEIVAVLDNAGNVAAWEGYVVSRLEAYARYRAGQSIVQRDHGPQRRFLFSLRCGEMVEMQHQGQHNIYRVESISKHQIEFRLHSDARPTTVRRKLGKEARICAAPSALLARGARKVVVDPLGQVLPAND